MLAAITQAQVDPSSFKFEDFDHPMCVGAFWYSYEQATLVLFVDLAAFILCGLLLYRVVNRFLQRMGSKTEFLLVAIVPFSCVALIIYPEPYWCPSGLSGDIFPLALIFFVAVGAFRLTRRALKPVKTPGVLRSSCCFSGAAAVCFLGLMLFIRLFWALHGPTGL